VTSIDRTLSLQERYAPASVCFGCGPANPIGLHIRSFDAPGRPDVLSDDAAVPGDWETLADWTPPADLDAFPGVLNGGIVSSLLDCHGNWTAATHLMRRRGLGAPPTTVTADLHVKLRRPTPSARPVRLRARVVEADDERASVDAELLSDGEITASARAVFVAVRPGHPAYGRW
jgi:acyl-coenzyme A thioesterase PaaI-like protein